MTDDGRLNLTDFVPTLLAEQPNVQMTAREIADLVRERRPDAWAVKQKRAGHTDTEARNQIVAEIGAHRHDMQRRHPQFSWFEEPHGQRVRRKFAWVAETTEEMEASAEAESNNVEREGLSPPAQPGLPGTKLTESDLYPKLATWLVSEFDVRSMRLEENRTASGAVRGTNWNHWRFPDVVGVEDLRDGWHRDIRDFANSHGAPRCRLWSFEVKLLLNRANVREYYLQAVSNSSWANRGYLVAAEVKQDDATHDELAILADAHGIGVIQLDANDITNTEIPGQRADHYRLA